MKKAPFDAGQTAFTIRLTGAHFDLDHSNYGYLFHLYGSGGNFGWHQKGSAYGGASNGLFSRVYNGEQFWYDVHSNGRWTTPQELDLVMTYDGQGRTSPGEGERGRESERGGGYDGLFVNIFSPRDLSLTTVYDAYECARLRFPPAPYSIYFVRYYTTVYSQNLLLDCSICSRCFSFIFVNCGFQTSLKVETTLTMGTRRRCTLTVRSQGPAKSAPPPSRFPRWEKRFTHCLCTRTHFPRL